MEGVTPEVSVEVIAPCFLWLLMALASGPVAAPGPAAAPGPVTTPPHSMQPTPVDTPFHSLLIDVHV